MIRIHQRPPDDAHHRTHRLRRRSAGISLRALDECKLKIKKHPLPL
jgi:hypothetical protein